MTAAAAIEAIEAVWRIAQPELAAKPARYLYDIGLADENVLKVFSDVEIGLVKRQRFDDWCAFGEDLPNLAGGP